MMFRTISVCFLQVPILLQVDAWVYHWVLATEVLFEAFFLQILICGFCFFLCVSTPWLNILCSLTCVFILPLVASASCSSSVPKVVVASQVTQGNVWYKLYSQEDFIVIGEKDTRSVHAAEWNKDEWFPLLGPWRFIVLGMCAVFMNIEHN